MGQDEDSHFFFSSKCCSAAAKGGWLGAANKEITGASAGLELHGYPVLS